MTLYRFAVSGRPLYVSRAVFDGAEDMSEYLERVRKQQAEESGEDEA